MDITIVILALIRCSQGNNSVQASIIFYIFTSLNFMIAVGKIVLQFLCHQFITGGLTTCF